MSTSIESENNDSIYEEYVNQSFINQFIQYDGIYEEYQSVNEKDRPKKEKKVTVTQDEDSAKRRRPRSWPFKTFSKTDVLGRHCRRLIRFPVWPRPRSSFKAARTRTIPFRPAEPC